MKICIHTPVDVRITICHSYPCTLLILYQNFLLKQSQEFCTLAGISRYMSGLQPGRNPNTATECPQVGSTMFFLMDLYFCHVSDLLCVQKFICASKSSDLQCFAKQVSCEIPEKNYDNSTLT